MDIANRIKFFREENKLSKNQLAKLANVSQSYISDIESGKKNPTLEILEQISNALGITLVHLISDKSSDLPPDLLQLMETAKKLSPEERQKLNEFLKVMKG